MNTNKMTFIDSMVHKIANDGIFRFISESKDIDCNYRAGKYEVLTSNDATTMYYFDIKSCDSIPQFGEYWHHRMYYSKEHTFCIMKRCENGRYFCVEIVDAPEIGEKKTKYKPVPIRNIPKIILQDLRYKRPYQLRKEHTLKILP